MEMKQTQKNLRMVVSTEKARKAFARLKECRESLEQRMKRSYAQDKDPLGKHNNDQLEAMMESCRATLKSFWEPRLETSRLFADSYGWSDLGAIAGNGGRAVFYPGCQMFDCLIALTESRVHNKTIYKYFLDELTYGNGDPVVFLQLVRVLHPEAVSRLIRACETNQIFCLLNAIDKHSPELVDSLVDVRMEIRDMKGGLIDKVAEAFCQKHQSFGPLLATELASDVLTKDAVRILREGGHMANSLADRIVEKLQSAFDELGRMLKEIQNESRW